MKRHVQEQGRTHMGISFRDTVTSFNTRFWGFYWLQHLCYALVGTSVVRALRILPNDRLRSSASGGENAPFAPRECGRLGYDTPVAQPSTFKPKLLHTSKVFASREEAPGSWEGNWQLRIDVPP